MNWRGDAINGEFQCLLDERADCVHVDFVYSLPDYIIIVYFRTMGLRFLLAQPIKTYYSLPNIGEKYGRIYNILNILSIRILLCFCIKTSRKEDRRVGHCPAAYFFKQLHFFLQTAWTRKCCYSFLLTLF